MFEHGEKILARSGLVAIHVAGRKQRYLAVRSAGGFPCTLALMPGQALAHWLAFEPRQSGLGVDASDRLQYFARQTGPASRVDRLRNDRDAQETADAVAVREHLAAPLDLALAEPDGLCAQHRVWEVEHPIVRRRIGALAHEAEAAQGAVFDLCGRCLPAHSMAGENSFWPLAIDGRDNYCVDVWVASFTLCHNRFARGFVVTGLLAMYSRRAE